ncbi:uncharacterized protein LOC134248403 [Saccostrea cucullata]|uniref:uncharacterized protein LOC134248403 n=1 Tax=Saccostrea cuccullata TaxID=36930 RepID=UPI002ED56F7D
MKNIMEKEYMYIIFPLLFSLCCHQAEGILNLADVTVYVDEFIINLGEEFENGDIDNAETIVLNLLRSVPGFGNVVKLFVSGGNSEINELYRKLDQMSHDVSQIKAVVQTIPSIIQISVIQKQVAEDEREINNCYLDSLSYLNNPTGSPEIDRMKTCYDKFQYVRDVSRILQGESVTFNQHSLFKEVKLKSGFCNGTEIVNIFKYLYGLFTKGCIAVGLAEQVKFENSTRINDECQSFVPRIFTFIREFYSTCQTFDLCSVEKEHNFMLQTISSDVENSIKFFKILFPWYEATLIRTSSPLDYEILDSTRTPSVMTVQRGFTYYSVLWFPVKTMFLHTNANNVSSFQVKFEGAYEIENGLNLTIVRHNKEIVLWGSVNVSALNVRLFNPCKHKIKAPMPAVSKTGLKDWEIALVVVGSLVAFVIIVCVIKRCCNNKDEDQPSGSVGHPNINLNQTSGTLGYADTNFNQITSLDDFYRH